MKNKRFLTIFLTIVFLFSLNHNEVQAKWDDKSDELPGMVSDGQIIAIAAGGAVLITGLIVFLRIKKKQERELESTSFSSKGLQSLDLADIKEPTTLYSELFKASEQSPVQFFACNNSFQNRKFCNEQAMTIGVRIKF